MDAVELAWKRYAEACCDHCVEAGTRALAEIPRQQTQRNDHDTVAAPHVPSPA